MDEVMQDGPGGAAGGVEVRAAEAIEREDVEMIAQQLGGVLGQEGIAVVSEVVQQLAELRALVVGY